MSSITDRGRAQTWLGTRSREKGSRPRPGSESAVIIEVEEAF